MRGRPAWIGGVVKLVVGILGVLVLVVGLMVSIGLHELGHMIPAKRFGVRVSRYMIGFGPTLWSRTRGETEYGFKAIPLGGYVKIVGMLAPAEAVGATSRPGVLGQMIQDARDASAEEILPGEEHRAFYQLSTPKKLVVMAGGTLTNLVVAALLFGVVMVGFGLPGSTTTVGMTLPCVLPVSAPVDRECTAQDPPTPAALADLRVGDVLLSYGGRSIDSFEDFLDAVQEVDGSQIQLVVERAGEQVTLEVSPIVTERPVWDAAGKAVLGADGEVVTEPSRYIGFSPTSVREPQPIGAVVPLMGEAVWGTLDVMVHLPEHLWDLGVAVFGGSERDVSVFGLVGMGQVAGEIATADGIGIGDRVAEMLVLVASLNVALFAFNLIPLLPLDGGHVAGALWEGAKRQVARWRGRPRPAPADMARMMPLANGVFVVLVLMGLFLVVADIVSPVTG